MLDNTREFDQTRETIARLLSNFQREGNDKFYYPCKICNGLKTRRIKMKIAKINCRENGHTKGGFYYHPLVSCLLYCFCN